MRDGAQLGLRGYRKPCPKWGLEQGTPYAVVPSSVTALVDGREAHAWWPHHHFLAMLRCQGHGVSAWQAHSISPGCEAGSVMSWILRHPCFPDTKVLPGARRVLGFSPVIVDRHISRFLLTFLTDDLGGL